MSTFRIKIEGGHATLKLNDDGTVGAYLLVCTPEGEHTYVDATGDVEDDHVNGLIRFADDLRAAGFDGVGDNVGAPNRRMSYVDYYLRVSALLTEHNLHERDEEGHQDQQLCEDVLCILEHLWWFMGEAEREQVRIPCELHGRFKHLASTHEEVRREIVESLGGVMKETT